MTRRGRSQRGQRERGDAGGGTAGGRRPSRSRQAQAAGAGRPLRRGGAVMAVTSTVRCPAPRVCWRPVAIKLRPPLSDVMLHWMRSYLLQEMTDNCSPVLCHCHLLLCRCPHLQEVAAGDDLYAAEGPRVAAKQLPDATEPVKVGSAHHADFVDDQRGCGSPSVTCIFPLHYFSNLLCGQICFTQPSKLMQGGAIDITCSYPSRRCSGKRK